MLQRLVDADFDAAYALMEASFPRDEYRPREGQRALLREPEYRLYGWREEAGVPPAALAAVWTLGQWLFLEHLAVAPARRSQGLGAAVLRALAELGEGRLCLEVEPPVDELTRRRVGFYRRNGFTLNHFPYLMPALAPGQQAMPLLLMCRGPELTQEEFEALRRLLYTRVYKVSAVG